MLNQATASDQAGARSQSASALEHVTPQGMERERLFRQRMIMVERENPIAKPKGRDQKKNAPDDHTFEVTTIDYKPLGVNSKAAAKMLAKARKLHDDNTSEDGYLKLDSRLLRSGDWLVWAEDLATRDWLAGFFLSDDFINDFRATLISDRGTLVRYTVKVAWPDSEDDNEEILDSILYNIGNPGYVRLSDELKWFSDPSIQKAQVAARKNKKTFTPPKDAMFDKMFWVKVSPDVHRILQDNWSRLRVGYGAGKLKIELAKGQESLLSSKRARSIDGDVDGERPAQAARIVGPEGETEVINLEEAELGRNLNRSLSQMSLERFDEDEPTRDGMNDYANSMDNTNQDQDVTDINQGQEGTAVGDLGPIIPEEAGTE